MARILTVLFVAATTTLVAQQAPRDLFERARMIEESNQKLADAIALYEQAAVQAAKEGRRDLAASALLRAGLLHERLGQKADAERAFKTVVTQYADQVDVARQAQAKLGAMTSASGAPSTRQVWAGVPIGPYGAPSPDGRLLSFVDWDTGNVAVRDLSSGAIRRVTTETPWTTGFAAYSVFSANSRQLAFGWQRFAPPGGSTTNSYELRTVGADGSNPRTVYSHAETSSIHPFAWTPDARQILAAFSNNDQTTQLVLVQADTGKPRVLKSFDWRGMVKASLSPDGAWIAYDVPPREDSPARDIYLLAADGGRQVPLVEHPANDLFPMWTPDGKHVVFLSDRSGTVAAWIQDISAGRPVGLARLLKADMTQAFPLGFTARGALYTMQPSPRDIYVASVESDSGTLAQPPARISEHLVGANSRPDWSPDGRQVAWLSERLAPASSARILCVLDVASGRVRELQPPLTSLDRPRWSPDGRSILVAAQQNGRYGLFTIDTTTGEFARAVQLPAPAYFNGHAWSRDGSAVFYIAVRPATDTQHVVRLDLASGRERAIDDSRGPKSDLALSRDGHWLAFRAVRPGPGSSQPANTIRIIAIDGSRARDLPLDGVPLAAFRGINWALDDRFLIFATANQKDRRYSLARVAVSGGAPERIAPGFSDRRLMDGRLHPDGRRLVFESGEDTDEIWVMENFLPSTAPKGVGRTRRP